MSHRQNIMILIAEARTKGKSKAQTFLNQPPTPPADEAEVYAYPLPISKAPAPHPINLSPPVIGVAGPSTPRTPTSRRKYSPYSPSVFSSTAVTTYAGSRKITSPLGQYPKTNRDGTIDKGKGKLVIDVEKEEQSGRAVGGAHMMGYPGSGMIWDHQKVKEMREEAAKKEAAKRSATPVATSLTPIRKDSMNPEDEDEDEVTEPNRPVFSKGMQTKKEKPKKRSLFRRISRAIFRF